jgi:pentachlorophenol monooxygenase/3-(3-hydroxy-phenyl)propionate hydroxylase
MTVAAAAGFAGPPVAVIGAGPVGQTAALLLARWGVPVVLLDARPARDLTGSKSIVQQRDVLDVWAAVGAGRQIAAEGLTWTRARTFYREHELFCLTFADRGRAAFPPFVNIPQSRTEQILDARIAAAPLIDMRWGHEVTALEQDAGGVLLRCRTGAGTGTLRASCAVACGGARGDALRGMLGVAFPGRAFNDHFLICDIRAELPGWEQERRFYFDPQWNPGRQVLIHPCPGSVFRIDWQVPPDFDLAAEQAGGGLDRRIRQILGERDYEIVWHSVYRFQARHADRLQVGRVLVAGDCAHLVSPFGARGLNSGVQDAENAAWKIAFVLRGWAGEPLLASYHEERLAAALENLEVTSATMDFLVPQTEPARRHRRDVLDRAVTDPSVIGQVDSGRLAEPFWYVDSPLTTPDPARPFPGRPPRGQLPPVLPGVLVPDLPIHLAGRPAAGRLREIARDGLLALTVPGADPAAVAGTLRSATPAPVRVEAIAALDDSGALADALDAEPGEVWLIRPDGHVAAVVPGADPAALRAAARRCLALPPDPR